MRGALRWLIFHKARAWACLVIIYVSLISSAWWLWGVLLLTWGARDLATGSTWLAEPVRKSEAPVLYYLISMSWLIMGFYLVLERFL